MSVIEKLHYNVCESGWGDSPDVLKAYHALFEAIKTHTGSNFDEGYFYDKVGALCMAEKEYAFKHGFKLAFQLLKEIS